MKGVKGDAIAFRPGKRILPILVSGDVSVNLLSPALSQIPFVDYLAKDQPDDQARDSR